MRRKLLASLVSLSILAPAFLASAPADVWAQRRRRPAPARRAAQASARNTDARVAEIADAYLRGHYAFNPTEATSAGLHEHDAQLESRSADAIARETRRLRAALADLSRVPEWRLAPDARYDYLVLSSHARARLLELEETQGWRRDPNVYNNLVASSVDHILKRAYAPIEQRLDAVLARERQIPRLLEEARANLDNPPRVYTETAVAQTRGSVDFFRRVVPQMFERAGGSRLSAARRAEFHAANEQAVAALAGFAEWLERDLLPRSQGDFRIGAELFRKKLLYEEMVETQDAMRAVAEEVAPGRGVAAALELLTRERPTAEALVGETRAELGRIRAFVRTEEILTPPARENLSVAETPEYARALSFASLDAPGPFERVATESYYYVTPPDPSLDAQRREEHLGYYNRYQLPVISMHEVYPGHYYQLLKSKQQPSRVRAAFGSASFVEGWAHYCEQMMLDEGFGGNNPKLRLAQLNAALLRLCRYLVGIRLHTAGMTYEDAVAFFMREGFVARANAEREARRGTLDPTYLVYTLGKMEILRLREEWRRHMGDSFRLGEFHDRLLSYGMPPVRVLRMAMLGDGAASSTRNGTNNFGTNGAQADEAKPVDFSVLSTGTMSDYPGARHLELVTNENEWRRVWERIGGGRPTPDVSFDARAVVVVYQGRQPTGGYSVEITGIKRVGTVLAVSVVERRPASGDVTTQAVTSPFVAASIPRPPTGATARFEGAREVEETQPNRKKTVRPRGTRRTTRRTRGR